MRKEVRILVLGLLLGIGLVSQGWGYSDTFGQYTINYGDLWYSIESSTRGESWVNACANEGLYPIEIDMNGEAIASSAQRRGTGSVAITAKRSFVVSHPTIPIGEWMDMPVGIKGNWSYDLWGMVGEEGIYANAKKEGRTAITNEGENILNQWGPQEKSIFIEDIGEASANNICTINTLTGSSLFLKVGASYYLTAREYGYLSVRGFEDNSAAAKIANGLDAKVVVALVPEPCTMLLLTLGLPFVAFVRRKR